MANVWRKCLKTNNFLCFFLTICSVLQFEFSKMFLSSYLLMEQMAASVHSIPCDTTFRGKTDVTENFYNVILAPQSTVDRSGFEVRLRGRALKGTKVALPNDYSGSVLHISTVPRCQVEISSITAGSPNGADGASPLQIRNENEEGSAAKRSRGWLMADEDDDPDDLFAARFRTEELKRKTEAPVITLDKTPQKLPSNKKSIANLPSIPSDNPLYPHPNTSSHSAGTIASTARQCILASPSEFSDEHGITRTISDADIVIVKDFPSIMMWEHDYAPSSQDTDGALLWIAVAEVLHSA